MHSQVLKNKIQELEKLQQSATEDPNGFFKLGMDFENIAVFDIEAYQYAILAFRTCYSQSGFYEAITKICHILIILDAATEALEILEKAVEKDSKSPILYNALGYTLLGFGREEEAFAAFEKAIEIEPKYIAPYKNLGNNKKFKKGDAFVDKVYEQLKYDHSLIDKSNLHAILGKILENFGDYREAFENYKLANDLRRSSFTYSVEKDESDFELLAQIFSKDLMAAKSSAPIQAKTVPIFILGMPRSGTTLVEQILASHSKIHGAGELQYLAQVIKMNNKSFPLYLKDTSIEDLQKQGDAYIGLLQQHGFQQKYICDKMPANFIYLPMIRLILPYAKVIHVKRDSMDTCLSNYKEMFTVGQYHSFNLEELGRYYKSYQILMQAWHELLPDFIFDLQYEDLISNQEEKTRDLLEFIGLDWEENCLEFHKNKKSVSTASITQVRQPIYKTSLQKWKRFENELQPLVEFLN